VIPRCSYDPCAVGAERGTFQSQEKRQRCVITTLSVCRRKATLLGRELNLFTEKKKVGKPSDFDHMADEELAQFIEAQGEVVRELERQLLPPPAPKQRKGATKH
jgi:hypothetical protein